MVAWASSVCASPRRRLILWDRLQDHGPCEYSEQVEDDSHRHLKPKRGGKQGKEAITYLLTNAAFSRQQFHKDSNMWRREGGIRKMLRMNSKDRSSQPWYVVQQSIRNQCFETLRLLFGGGGADRDTMERQHLNPRRIPLISLRFTPPRSARSSFA
jgi:hypothetical protein